MWVKAIIVWLIIVAAETLHGILRQLYLAPQIGDLPARQVGVFIGSGIILGVACLFIRWINPKTYTQQFLIGLLWVVLIAVFEFSLGFALGYSRERMLEDYDLSRGGLMGGGLLFLLFAPMIAARLRQRP
ncbi:MAG: hypothetical protein ABL888_06270 [Pirellulaceae bacterium]